MAGHTPVAGAAKPMIKVEHGRLTSPPVAANYIEVRSRSCFVVGPKVQRELIWWEKQTPPTHAKKFATGGSTANHSSKAKTDAATAVLNTPTIAKVRAFRPNPFRRTEP